MAMTMFLVGTEKKKEAKTFAMMTMLLARLVMVTMAMVTTVMALLTILVALTAMIVNPPDSGDAVGEVNRVSDANDVGKSCDGDNGDGDNSDGIVNNIGGNDSNDVGNPPDRDDAVGERKKKGKRVQQSKGGGDDNCGLDGPNHNETNSGDGNDNFLGGNRKKEGGKDIGGDDNIVG
jgi:hypothetical protein